MSDKENNGMLSFDKLRDELGINEDELTEIKENVEANIEDNVVDESLPIQEEKDPMPEGTRVTENGKTFLDITAQYVNTDEPVVEEKKTEAPEPVVKKKRIRTFNEIFSDFFGSFLPKRGDTPKEIVRKLVMDISVIAIVCCAVAFVKYAVDYKQQIDSSDEIKGQIIEIDTLDENKYVEAWQELFAQYPDIQFPEGMNIKYSYLFAVNQDLVGWLKVDGTSLDVQIVQSKDNDYYLNRDFYGKKSRYGCPYVDYRNDVKELDDNTVIYGHHMSDGLMFSNLDKYKTVQGYKESPLITFSTLYDTYTFKVFAAFIATDSPATDGGFNYTISEFSSDAKFTEFIDEVRLRSLFNSDVSVQTDDKIITLVTCSHEFDDARLVVMGRMVRENESTTVNVDAATVNASPKYPQAWYDKKNLQNPYAE